MQRTPEFPPALIDMRQVSPTMPSLTYASSQDADQESTLPLSHFLWILKRHRWKILGFISFCVLISTLVSLQLVPIFEATATLDVDRQTPQGIVGAEANRSALNDADQFMATQMKVIESDSVLRPVALQYKLQEQDMKNDEKDPTRAAARRDAPVSLKKLRITRPQNTYLLNVSYRSPDPHLAASVANGIAQSYITHTFDLRFRAAASQSTFMEKQVEELRAKMERSSGALVQYEKELNFINPEEKTSILSARLLQLNTEYTSSQGDRIKREAELNSIGTGSMEAALASTQGESLRKLLEHQNEAQERFALARAQYGANHPEFRKAAGQLAEVQRLFDQTQKNIIARVSAEFRQANSRETMLRKAFMETKGEFDKLNTRSFEYLQLRREAESDKKLYEELTRRIKEAGINASFQNNSIRLGDSARPPVKSVFPNIPLNILLAFVFSCLLSVGAALLSDVLDNTVRDPDELARALNVQVLGSLPLVTNWRMRISPLPATSNFAIDAVRSEDKGMYGFREAIRTLRNTILLADFDRRIRSIMVTSASPSEGKSTTSVHLAIAHAEQGKRTLLIDGDLRRPSIHRKFGFTATAGLSNVLLGELNWNQVLVQPEGVPNLDILPAGPPSRRASELVGAGLADTLEEMSREYDMVIIDAPPLLGFAEALQMSACIDGVLVVARSGTTNKKALGIVVHSLRRLHVKILGLVINEVENDSSDTYYYYQSNAKYYMGVAES